MRDLTYIKTSNRELPLRCSNFVLEKIQDKFENLKSFEEKLFNKKPDIKVLNEFLYMCVYEGLQLEALIENKPCEKLTPRDVLVLCDLTVYELQVELIKEYTRAFEIKN